MQHLSNEEKLAQLIKHEQFLLSLKFEPQATPEKGMLDLNTTGTAATALTIIRGNQLGFNPLGVAVAGLMAYPLGKVLSKYNKTQIFANAEQAEQERLNKLKDTRDMIAYLKEEMGIEATKKDIEEAEIVEQTKEQKSNEQAKLFRDLNRLIPVSDMKKNTYVSGKTGSGKTELLKTLFYKLQFESKDDNRYSLVFIDPHGDVAQELKAFGLNRNVGRLVYVDPYMSNLNTPVLNPLEIPNKNIHTIDIHSQQIVEVFKELLGDARLSNQMETILKPCLFTILLEDNPSLLDLQRFMNDDENEDLIEKGKESPFKPHRAFFETQFNNPNFDKTKSSIYIKIQSLLNTPTFYNLVVGKSTIDLETLLDEGKVIIFNLAKGEMGKQASNHFGRFLIANMQSIAQRRGKQAKKDRKPSFVFIDECQNYITPSISTILTETRKYGLHLILANQFINQINTETQQAILSSTSVKVVGVNNQETYKKLAPNLNLKISDLQELNQYDFYVKSGNNEPTIYRGSNLLIKDSTYLLSPSEIKKMDRYIVEHSGVYQAIEG